MIRKDKPIEILTENSINEFSKIIDKKHKNNCPSCGQEFDMRDLSQVFAHEPCKGIVDYETMEQIPHSSSQKIGEDITWSNAKWFDKPLK